MTDRILVRSYRSRDERHIASLFLSVFGRPLSLSFWRWRFLENPCGARQILTAWLGGELVGHYALSPVVLSVKAEERPAALAVCIMTHPDHRQAGVASALVEGMCARTEQQDLAMVYGFPNVNSHRGFVRDLGWIDLHEVPCFRLDLSSPLRLPAPAGRLMAVKRFGPEFDELWARAITEETVAVRRDASYLCWRFGRGSGQRYRAWAIRKDGRLSAYAVTKPYQDGEDLVDLLYDDDQVGLELISAIALRARQRGKQRLQMWLNAARPLHWELERGGFRNEAPVTYFAGEWLGGRRHAAVAQDYRRWHVTMGDSDVF